MSNLRAAYGETLVELGKDNDKIVVLEADLGKSTMGCLFEQAFPSRFYEMGIAEANMAATAAGLSLTGKVPFMASFAVFCPGRCYDQIRTAICIPSLNVKICGSSAGLSDYGDGATHQSVDDIALMRVLPNMRVFCAADARETRQIVRYMAENDGPMYLRVSRADLPDIPGSDGPFHEGEPMILRKGNDAAVFAAGAMVHSSLEAAEELAGLGCNVTVVNVPSIKPLNHEAVRKIARSVPRVMTIEEHSTAGGLGDAISEALAGMPSPYRLGILDSFGASAQNYEVLLKAYRLDTDSIAESILAVAAGRPADELLRYFFISRQG